MVGGEEKSPSPLPFSHSLLLVFHSNGDQVRKVLDVLAWVVKGLSSPAESAILFFYPVSSTPTTELFLKQRNKKTLFYWEKHSDTLTHPLDRESLSAPQVLILQPNWSQSL